MTIPKTIAPVANPQSEGNFENATTSKAQIKRNREGIIRCEPNAPNDSFSFP
jgi:hypothetical protein